MMMMMMRRLNARNVRRTHQIAMLNSANYNNRTWLLGKRPSPTITINDYVTDVGDKQWLLVDG